MGLRHVLEQLRAPDVDEEALVRSRARLLAAIEAERHRSAVAPPRLDPPPPVDGARRRRGRPARMWLPIAASFVIVAVIVGGVVAALAQRALDPPVAASSPAESWTPIDGDSWYACGPVAVVGSSLTAGRGVDALNDQHARMLDEAAPDLGDVSQWIVEDSFPGDLALLAPAEEPGAFGEDVQYIRLVMGAVSESADLRWTTESGTCTLQRVDEAAANHPFEVAPSTVRASRELRLAVLTSRCAPTAEDYVVSRVAESRTTIEVTIREEPVSPYEFLCLPSDPHRFELTVSLDAPVGDRTIVQPGRVPAEAVWGDATR